jgi:hypothetical protein
VNWREQKKRRDVLETAKQTIDGLVSPAMVEAHDRFLGVKLIDLDKDDLIKALVWVGFRKQEDNKNTR